MRFECSGTFGLAAPCRKRRRGGFVQLSPLTMAPVLSVYFACMGLFVGAVGAATCAVIAEGVDSIEVEVE